jgi:zinc/manganese transport system substrate-binding protein
MDVRRALCAALTIPLLGGLAACAPITATDGRLRVVASTDVYGDIARAVSGRDADVSALIDDPSQDPHSFEASARDQLAVAKADVIVENGGGYDDFVERMRHASGKRGAVVVNVLRLSGRTAPPGGQLNEHVFYDLDAVLRLVTRLVAVLSAARPGLHAAFAANAARLGDGLRELVREEAALRRRLDGTAIAITEPVPVYLLDACGLRNRTPEQFSASVEAGTDVSASVLRETLDLFDHHAVRALVYNEQTTGAETTRLLAAAAADHVPAIGVTETLPAGDTYLAWMRSNLAAIRKALL